MFPALFDMFPALLSPISLSNQSYTIIKEPNLEPNLGSYYKEPNFLGSFYLSVYLNVTVSVSLSLCLSLSLSLSLSQSVSQSFNP